MIVSFLPSIAAVFMLMFARFGTMIMLLPALGEQRIPTRVRLSFALLFTLVMYPAASGLYPVTPTTTLPRLMALMAGEMMVGFFVGMAARLILSALQVAGTAIANQMGLAFAQSVDPTQGIQGVLYSNFLTILGITLIFVTDLHHLAIGGIYDSLQIFPPGRIPPVGDMAKLVLMTIVEAFEVGLQIAAPFLVFGLVFYLGLGLLNRLMPQVQIFFVAMPANIMFGLVLTFLLIGSIMSWYLGHVETGLGRFLVK